MGNLAMKHYFQIIWITFFLVIGNLSWGTELAAMTTIDASWYKAGPAANLFWLEVPNMNDSILIRCAAGSTPMISSTDDASNFDYVEEINPGNYQLIGKQGIFCWEEDNAKKAKISNRQILRAQDKKSSLAWSIQSKTYHGYNLDTNNWSAGNKTYDSLVKQQFKHPFKPQQKALLFKAKGAASPPHATTTVGHAAVTPGADLMAYASGADMPTTKEATKLLARKEFFNNAFSMYESSLVKQIGDGTFPDFSPGKKPGEFSVWTVKELRDAVAVAQTSGNITKSGGGTFNIITFAYTHNNNSGKGDLTQGDYRRFVDVGALQANPANKDAVFQLASRFHCLEGECDRQWFAHRTDQKSQIDAHLTQWHSYDRTNLESLIDWHAAQAEEAVISATPGAIWRMYYLAQQSAGKADDDPANIVKRFNGTDVNLVQELRLQVLQRNYGGVAEHDPWIQAGMAYGEQHQKKAVWNKTAKQYVINTNVPDTELKHYQTNLTKMKEISTNVQKHLTGDFHTGTIDWTDPTLQSLVDKVMIGFHADIPVTTGLINVNNVNNVSGRTGTFVKSDENDVNELVNDPTQQKISQALTAALDISKNHRHFPIDFRQALTENQQAYAACARTILQGCFQGAILATILHRKKKIFLTRVGTGAFGNPKNWALEAIKNTKELIHAYGLNATLVYWHDGTTDNLSTDNEYKEYKQLVTELGGTIMHYPPGTGVTFPHVEDYRVPAGATSSPPPPAAVVPVTPHPLNPVPYPVVDWDKLTPSTDGWIHRIPMTATDTFLVKVKNQHKSAAPDNIDYPVVAVYDDTMNMLGFTQAPPGYLCSENYRSINVTSSDPHEKSGTDVLIDGSKTFFCAWNNKTKKWQEVKRIIDETTGICTWQWGQEPKPPSGFLPGLMPRCYFFEHVMGEPEATFATTNPRPPFPVTQFSSGTFAVKTIAELRQEKDKLIAAQGGTLELNQKPRFNIITNAWQYVEEKIKDLVKTGKDINREQLFYDRHFTDIGALQASPENKHAVFQIASRFHCLEGGCENRYNQFISGNAMGIIGSHAVQGEEAAISAAPGLIWRMYYQEQADIVKTLGLTITDGGMITYSDATNQAKMEEIKTTLKIGPTGNERIHWHDPDINALVEQCAVGVHIDVQVTSGLSNSTWHTIEKRKHNKNDSNTLCDDPTQLITQVFCASLDLGTHSRFSTNDPVVNTACCRLLLKANYEATLLAAVAHRKKKVFLTLLGGGAFKNKKEWIIDAIKTSEDLILRHNLDVTLVFFHDKCETTSMQKTLKAFTTNNIDEDEKNAYAKAVKLVQKIGGTITHYPRDPINAAAPGWQWQPANVVEDYKGESITLLKKQLFKVQSSLKSLNKKLGELKDKVSELKKKLQSMA